MCIIIYLLILRAKLLTRVLFKKKQTFLTIIDHELVQLVYYHLRLTIIVLKSTWSWMNFITL